MEKPAFVARQKSTPQGSSTRCGSSARVRGPAEALPGHREQVLGAICGQASWSVAPCFGQVGDGEADEVSKFGSEEHAERVHAEFSSIARFFVEKAM